ncbi:MAG: hypothetical protein H3C47_10725 [Candidatus Cloacimonetes bacterium]|nr:hypothetical protein [Candidatus Cloacimonadota bacterium]
MHPIIDSFLKSVDFGQESQELCRSVYSIRERAPLLIGCNLSMAEDMDILAGLRLLFREDNFTDLDLVLSNSRFGGQSEYRIWKYFCESGIQYEWFQNHSLSEGFSLSLGANRLHLGHNAEFSRFDASDSIGSMTFKEALHYQRQNGYSLDGGEEFKRLRLMTRREREKEVIHRIITETHAQVSTETILSEWLDSPLFAHDTLMRSDVKAFGVPIENLESSGIEGILNRLLELHQALLNSRSILEGPMDGDKKFSAQCTVVGIFENHLRRILALKFEHLPQAVDKLIVFVEK